MVGRFFLLDKNPILLFLTIMVLLSMSCKTASIYKTINEVANNFASSENPLTGVEKLEELERTLDEWEQYKWNKKNRFLFFYNKGLLKTLLVLKEIKEVKGSNFDFGSNILDGVNAYQECFKMLQFDGVRVSSKELEALRYNSCYLHNLLNYLDENSDNQNRENQNSSQDQNSNENKTDKENQASSQTSEDQQNQNDSSQNNDDEQNQSNQNQTNKNSSDGKNQLTDKLLEELNSNKNNKQDQKDLVSEKEGKENKDQQKEEMASSLLQALYEEEQRKEENQKIIMQEGYYYVEKDW